MSSLNQFQNQLKKTPDINAGNPSNNFGRPNLNPNNGGLLEKTNVGNILNGSSNFNAFMARQYTLDPIAYGSTGTSSSIGGMGFLETTTAVLTGLTGLATLTTAGIGIAQGIKTLKKSSSSSDTASASDQTLATLTQTADEYDKKSDFNSMRNTAENLSTAINTANTKLNNAKTNLASAEKKLTNLNSDKAKFAQQLETFNTEKDAVQTSLESHKNALSQLEAVPEAQRTPEQKAQIQELKRAIQEEENALKTTYSDNRRRTIENQIIRIDDELQECQNKIYTYKN
ncbi:TPA: hypothetical protein CPT85_05690, partial [Candidatus Gastranaerophilales bacterium HUM_21]